MDGDLRTSGKHSWSDASQIPCALRAFSYRVTVGQGVSFFVRVVRASIPRSTSLSMIMNSSARSLRRTHGSSRQPFYALTELIRIKSKDIVTRLIKNRYIDNNIYHTNGNDVWTMRTQIHFFATKQDLGRMLETFESKGYFKYVYMSAQLTKQSIVKFDRGVDIPNLGMATASASSSCDTFWCADATKKYSRELSEFLTRNAFSSIKSAIVTP